MVARPKMKTFCALLGLIVLGATGEGCVQKTKEAPQRIADGADEDGVLFSNGGDLILGFLFEDCGRDVVLLQTYLHSAVWTCERLNVLDFFNGLKLGCTVFRICDEKDSIGSVFKMYQRDELLLGIITNFKTTTKVQDIIKLLDIQITEIATNFSPVIEATVALLNNLELYENITIIASNADILKEFYEEAAKDWICVTNGALYSQSHDVQNIGNLVIIGDSEEIECTLSHLQLDANYTPRVIVASTDGKKIDDLPESTYEIQPLKIDYTQKYQKSSKVLPSSILLETAAPILSISQNANNIAETICNETKTKKLHCMKQIMKNHQKQRRLSSEAILEKLDIEPLQDKFIYNIYNTEQQLLASSNDTFGVVSITTTHQMFNNNQTEERNRTTMNWTQCRNVLRRRDDTTTLTPLSTLMLRQEAWVLAILTISALGVTLCIAILAFFVVSICQRESLEGNPTLTMFLLLATILAYVAVAPFAVTSSDDDVRENICLVRAMSVTLTYATIFSLILSRCVLLASVSTESEFMSHVPGPVQAMLTILMVAVQGALNVQLLGQCQEVVGGHGYAYFLAYDVLLLAFLLCSCPLVVKSQRNYREGRYFTLTVILLVIGWTVWISVYLMLDDEWSDLVVCAGMLYTGSTFLGSVFIPRTYLMTSAATRDRLTGTFPSLTTSSALDLYHAGGAHVYDCVNVPTINATIAARASLNAGNSIQTIPASDLYDPPLRPLHQSADSFSINDCNSVDTDKVTRF